MKLPKETEGRYLVLLLEGIPAVEIKITSIAPDEIIGTYVDGEELHCSHEHLRAWWSGKAPGKRARPSDAQIRKMQEGKRRSMAKDRGDITES